MKHHVLFVVLKKRQNLKMSSAANYRWRFKGIYHVNFAFGKTKTAKGFHFVAFAAEQGWNFTKVSTCR